MKKTENQPHIPSEGDTSYQQNFYSLNPGSFQNDYLRAVSNLYYDYNLPFTYEEKLELAKTLNPVQLRAIAQYGLSLGQVQSEYFRRNEPYILTDIFIQLFFGQEELKKLVSHKGLNPDEFEQYKGRLAFEKLSHTNLKIYKKKAGGMLLDHPLKKMGKYDKKLYRKQKISLSEYTDKTISSYSTAKTFEPPLQSISFEDFLFNPLIGLDAQKNQVNTIAAKKRKPSKKNKHEKKIKPF